MDRKTRFALGLLALVSAPVLFVLCEAPADAATTASCGMSWSGPASMSFDLTHVFVAGGVALVAIVLLASCLFGRKPRVTPADTHAV